MVHGQLEHGKRKLSVVCHSRGYTCVCQITQAAQVGTKHLLHTLCILIQAVGVGSRQIILTWTMKTQRQGYTARKNTLPAANARKLDSNALFTASLPRHRVLVIEARSSMIQWNLKKCDFLSNIKLFCSWCTCQCTKS